MPFKDLPTEIHLAIISHLDYTALLKFHATNHYFQSLQDIKQKKAALSDFEKEAVGSPDKDFKDSDALAKRLKSGTHLPCYFCLKFLNPATHFESSQTNERFALGQEARIRRRCARCSFFRGFAVFKESEIFVSSGATWIGCVACQETKRYPYTELQKQAWTEARKCAECFVSNGATWIGCVACQETKRHPYTELQKQAWTAARMCAECYWFKIAACTLGWEGEEYIALDMSKAVRVTSMSKKAAKELCEELESRKTATDLEWYIAAVAAIERAAEPLEEQMAAVFRRRMNNTLTEIHFEGVVKVLAESGPPSSTELTETYVPEALPTIFGLLASRISTAWASIFAR